MTARTAQALANAWEAVLRTARLSTAARLVAGQLPGFVTAQTGAHVDLAELAARCCLRVDVTRAAVDALAARQQIHPRPDGRVVLGALGGAGVTGSVPAAAVAGNRAQDAAPTAKRSPNVKAQDSAEAAWEARQWDLRALVRQVAGGDGPPLDRLRAVEGRGRQLIASGGPRVALITALMITTEAAGVARRAVQNISGEALRGGAA